MFFVAGNCCINWNKTLNKPVSFVYFALACTMLGIISKYGESDNTS